MVKKVSNTRKVIRWIFDFPYEYRKTKQSWQRQSAFVKIASILAVVALLALSCFIFYWTGRAFNALSGRDFEAIVRSLFLFFGIMILVLTDIIFIVNMYRQLIFNATVAFVCRPAKKSKLQNEAAEVKDAQVTEEENNTEEQTQTEEENKESAETLTPDAIRSVQKSKTSRGFDTAIGWLNIALILIYTAGLILAFAGGYGFKA